MIKRNPIKILITGCGAPGISGTVHSLKNNPNNDKVLIVGTDTNKEAVGKFFAIDLRLFHLSKTKKIT